MKTKRLQLVLRTRECLEQLLSDTQEVQSYKLGVDDVNRLVVEMERVERLLLMRESEYRLWDVIDLSSQKVIGNCGFHNIKKEHRRGEIGYWIKEKYRRKGLMKEAVVSMLSYGFDTLGFYRVEALLDRNNIASKKLVESLGFTQEGELRGHFWQDEIVYDSLMYSLLSSEWSK